MTTAKWFTILYSNTSLKSHLWSASDYQPRSFNIWITLLVVCLWSFFTFLAALCWSISSASLSLHRCVSLTAALYSTTDHTRLNYAISLSFGGAFFRLCRRNLRVLFAFLVMAETWADHCKSFDIISYRYSKVSGLVDFLQSLSFDGIYFLQDCFLPRDLHDFTFFCIKRHTPAITPNSKWFEIFL